MQYKFVQVKLNQLHYLREKIVDIHGFKNLEGLAKSFWKGSQIYKN